MDNKKAIWIGAAGVIFVLILLIFLVNVISNNNKNKTVKTDTLTVWSFSDKQTDWADIISEFQTASNIKVNFVKKNPDEYLAESLNELAAGRGPDVWMIPNDWLPKYHDKIVAMPTGTIADKKQKKDDLEVYRDTFLSAVSQDNIIKNKIYGVPLAIDPLVMFYNNEVLNQAQSDYTTKNPDAPDATVQLFNFSQTKNWDELTSAIKLITSKSGATINRSGIALGTTGNIKISADILSWMMMQAGTKMVSEDLALAQFHTKQNLFGGADFPGRLALERYANFANSSKPEYSWNGTLADSRRAFAEGKTALLIDYLSAADDIKLINPNLDYEVAAVPQLKEAKNPVGFISYTTLTVPKTSKNQTSAWDFILFAANIDNINTYLSNVKKPGATITDATNGSETYSPSLLAAQSWYKPEPAQADTVFNQMIQQVNQGTDVQTALEEGANKITDLLAKIANIES